MPTKIATCVWWLLWMCFLSNAFATTISQDVPFVKISSPNKSFVKGKNAILEVRFCKSCNITCDHNGKSLPDTVKLRKALDHLNVLEISHLDENHNGFYNCMARNKAGTANATYELFVEGPPKWTMTLANSTAILGSQHEWRCIAECFPEAAIKWWRVIDNKDIPLDSNENYLISANSTKLTIKKVRLEDIGVYKCTAFNGIGKEIQTSGYLTILLPPKFIGETNNQTVRIGEGQDALIEFAFTGDSIVFPTLAKNGKSLDLASRKPKIEFHVSSPCLEACVIKLKIPNTLLQDAGLYKITIQNPAGKAATQFVLNVRTKPETPTNLQVENVMATSITTTWNLPKATQNKDPVNSVQVEYREKDILGNSTVHNKTEWKSLQLPGHARNGEIQGLKPMQTYEIRIRTLTAFSVGKASEPLTVSTLPELPKQVPQNVVVTPSLPTSQVTTEPEKTVNMTVKKITQRSISLSWGSALKGESPIFAYMIHYNKGDGELNKKVLKNPKQRKYTLKGLECNTKYWIKLEAVNASDELAYSSEITGKTAGTTQLPAIDINTILSGNGTEIRLDMRKLNIDKCQRLIINVEFRIVGEINWRTGHHQGHATSTGADVITIFPRKLGIYEILVSLSNGANRTTKRFILEVQTNSVKALANFEPRKDVPVWLIILITLVTAAVVCVLIPPVKEAVKEAHRQAEASASETKPKMEMGTQTDFENAEETFQMNYIVLPAQSYSSSQLDHPQPQLLSSMPAESQSPPQQSSPELQVSPSDLVSPPKRDQESQTIARVHFSSIVDVYVYDSYPVSDLCSTQL